MLLSKFMEFIHLHHICGINRKTGVSQGSRFQSRQGTPSLTATCLVLLSFFWQHVFFTYFPTSDFNQTWSHWPVCWPLIRHKQWWGQMSGWGHWGQKSHFHQKGIKCYRILSTDAWLMHIRKLDPLYKTYGPKNSSGVIWGHRGKKIIFTKKASRSTEYVALTRDLRTCISLTPSTKFMVLKISTGSFGVTGVKRSFSLKML